MKIKKLCDFLAIGAIVTGALLAVSHFTEARPPLPVEANGDKIQVFTPRTFAIYSGTKGPININVTGAGLYRFRSSAAVTYDFGAAPAFPVDVNVVEMAGVPENKTVMRVFPNISTAATNKMKIYMQMDK